MLKVLMPNPATYQRSKNAKRYDRVLHKATICKDSLLVCAKEKVAFSSKELF